MANASFQDSRAWRSVPGAGPSGAGVGPGGVFEVMDEDIKSPWDRVVLELLCRVVAHAVQSRKAAKVSGRRDQACDSDH